MRAAVARMESGSEGGRGPPYQPINMKMCAKMLVHETAKWEKLRWRVRLFILLDFKVRYLTTSVGQSVRYECPWCVESVHANQV